LLDGSLALKLKDRFPCSIVSSQAEFFATEKDSWIEKLVYQRDHEFQGLHRCYFAVPTISVTFQPLDLEKQYILIQV
jgi:hypothetical protein